MAGNKYNLPKDSIGYIKDLEKRIERLERAPRMVLASLGDVNVAAGGKLTINGGDMEVQDAEGQTVLFVGAVTESDLLRPDTTPQPVFFLLRDDGSYVLTVYDANPSDAAYAQYWNMYDREQNIILGDDRLSGQGLARPYIPWRVSGKSQSETTTVTSPSWETLFTLRGVKQHPKLSVTLDATAPAATTGTVRLYHTPSSTVLAGPSSIAASTTVALDWVADLSSSTFLHMDVVDVEIQAQRNTGAGTISARAFTAYGRET